MSQSVFFALAGVLIATATGTIQRLLMRRDGDLIAVLLFNQFAACLVLVAFFGLPRLWSFSLPVLLLLGLSGFFWALKGWAMLNAHKHLDLNTSALLGQIKFLILFVVSAVVFGEKMSGPAFTGIFLIGAALVINFYSSAKNGVKGMLFNILGTAACMTAIMIEKMLTRWVDAASISVAAFLFPALLILFLNPGKTRLIPSAFRESRGLLLLLPFGYAGGSYMMIKSLELGSLVSSMAIKEMNMLFAFLAGYIFLKERSNLIGKVAGSILCTAGAMIVSFAS